MELDSLKHSSNMITSGNLFCSEISYLAAIPFNFKHKIARLDITAHTVYEIKVDERWIIVDPLFNFQLKNKENKLVTLEELSLENNIALNTTKLKSKDEIINYRKVFTKKFYTPQPKEAFTNNKHLRKTTFGERKLYDFSEPYFTNAKKNFKNLNTIFDQIVKNFADKDLYSYILYTHYYLPILFEFYNTNTKKENIKFVHKIQNHFINAIKTETILLWSKEYFKLWKARQLQFLGRVKSAKSILIDLKKQKIWNDELIDTYIKKGEIIEKYYKSSPTPHD